jgi:hypothetical protein
VTTGDPPAAPPRLRQAVLVARELEPVAGALREELGLGEPFADPGVGHFGLRNAVFALGDTFLEVVSPEREGTSAGRLLDRHGSDCGYMVMFQVADLEAARRRLGGEGVREVFEVSLEDMAEVHLHPADMRGAIVSLSEPRPAASWRWGGPDWDRRSAPLELAGATISVTDPQVVARRWETVLGSPTTAAGVRIAGDETEQGLVEIALSGGPREAFEIGGVRFVFDNRKEEP